jgi:polysaccharide export outer membrane protein
MARRSTIVMNLAAVLWISTIFGQSDPPPAAPNVASALRLGPEDMIQIRAVDAEEINEKPIRISADGFITVPIIGRIKAAGLTVDELQAIVVERLKPLIIKPDVSVGLLETHSHPFTVLGAVKTPGVFQLSGRKTLLDALSLSGGPRDDAGYTVRISRRKESGPLPLPGAAPDATGEYTIAEVNLPGVLDARDPAANIALMPDDVISVPKGDMVYVIGEVTHPLSIVIGGPKTVTALQALAIAAGMTKMAKSKDGRILRITPGSTKRTEIAVNLQEMLHGKLGDITMQADDILYVPNSVVKEIGMSAAQMAVGSGLTSLIYRLP